MILAILSFLNTNHSFKPFLFFFQITLINWMEYLSDFLELIGIIELSNHVATIKRGHYGLVDIQAKLAILRELVCRVIETEYFKEKLDEDIEKKQALAATRRDEILEESRKKREEDHLKIQSNGKEATKGCGNSSDTGSDNHLRENGDVPSRNGKRTSSQSKHSLEDRFVFYVLEIFLEFGW